MKLFDLSAGTEFEYVDQEPFYRRGKFLVLNICFAPINRTSSIAILSYVTKKVCNHYGELEVNTISKSGDNMKSQKEMGHFIGWKFGVPVKVYEHNPGEVNYPEYEEARLIEENGKTFIIMYSDQRLGYRSKQNFHYELIPYKVGDLNPRYPICSNSSYVAYCNGGGVMQELDRLGASSLKPYPVATLNIDGKTIELSAETTAELKKKLEI